MDKRQVLLNRLYRLMGAKAKEAIMNTQLIYENFKQNAAYEEEGEQPFFAPAAPESMAILTNLYDTCLSCSTVWTAQDLDHLRGLKIPAPILRFYQEMNPIHAPMNDAGVDLADLDHMRDEYSQLAPGCYCIKFGLLVIGTTTGGNPIIVDLYDESAPVFICDHTLLSHEQKEGQVTLYFLFPPKSLQEEYGSGAIPVNRDTILACLTPIEKSFETFITKLSQNEYEDDLEDLLD